MGTSIRVFNRKEYNMYHKIKLRRDEQTTAVTCPYAVSGICHRRGCIFIPHQRCLNKREYDRRIAIAKNMSSKKQKFVKRAKRG